MTQKPAKLYKFLENYYPLVYKSPVRGNSSAFTPSQAGHLSPSHLLPACRAHYSFLHGLPMHQLLAPGIKILCATPQFLICFVLYLLTNFL